jgi:hypothetical protein
MTILAQEEYYQEQLPLGYQELRELLAGKDSAPRL